MRYEKPGCAYCPPVVQACRQGESEKRGPGYCPSKVDQEAIDAASMRNMAGFVGALGGMLYQFVGVMESLRAQRDEAD